MSDERESMTYEESACVCHECGKLDPTGYSTEYGHFLCRRCWSIGDVEAKDAAWDENTAEGPRGDG